VQKENYSLYIHINVVFRNNSCIIKLLGDQSISDILVQKRAWDGKQPKYWVFWEHLHVIQVQSFKGCLLLRNMHTS